MIFISGTASTLTPSTTPSNESGQSLCFHYLSMWSSVELVARQIQYMIKSNLGKPFTAASKVDLIKRQVIIN